MKISRALAVFTACLLAWPAIAAAPVTKPFKVSASRYFEPVLITLDALVAQKATATINHLCVLGQTLDDGITQAWVIWPEGNAIILWVPTSTGIADLAVAETYLDMNKDVVAENDPRLTTSTYLVSRPWANSLIAECRHDGNQYVLNRKDAQAAFKKLKPDELSP